MVLVLGSALTMALGACLPQRSTPRCLDLECPVGWVCTAEPEFICVPENGCGNGRIDSGETCDDGHIKDGDGCSGNCRIETACGDGIEEGFEQCDDGNNDPGDGCSANCQLESCGNRHVDPGEQCDEGEATPTCDADCTLPTCGDGLPHDTEECDEVGDTMDCDGDCTLATCGDGYVNQAAGEQCDDGNDIGTDGCKDCMQADCGNGVVDEGEECDTRGESATCDADCTMVQCGDDTINDSAGEACDDANTEVDDSCPSGLAGTCQAAYCGDGFTWSTGGGTEECDDANSDMNDGCLNTCVAATCGDGVVWVGVEECDDGDTPMPLNDACPSGSDVACPSCPEGTCQWAYCGDGFIWNTDGGSEECDDGNSSNSDHCVSCKTAQCGDGFVNLAGGERCDDGNALTNDACPSGPTVPPRDPSEYCQPVRCGDGFACTDPVTCGENLEDCDGSDMGTCPSTSSGCNMNCTCMG